MENTKIISCPPLPEEIWNHIASFLLYYPTSNKRIYMDNWPPTCLYPMYTLTLTLHHSKSSFNARWVQTFALLGIPLLEKITAVARLLTDYDRASRISRERRQNPWDRTERRQDPWNHISSIHQAKWLIQKGLKPLFHTKVLDVAAKSGTLDFVKWLDERFLGACSTLSLTNAARRGDLEMVKYFLGQEACFYGAIAAVAHADHLGILKYVSDWVFTSGPGLIRNPQALDWAANEGHHDVVSWMLKNLDVTWHEALNTAIRKDDLEMVKLIYNKPHLYDLGADEIEWDCIIGDATRAGRGRILRWFVDQQQIKKLEEGKKRKRGDSHTSRTYVDIDKKTKRPKK